MKYTAILFLLCCYAALPGQGLKWEKTYGSPGSDACQVVVTPDGGLAVLAYFGIDPFVLRTNANGDTIWTKRLPPHDFCTLATTQDGGFISTGATRAAIRDFVAHRLDAAGDSLWTQIYSDSLDQGHYQVIETTDGGFVLSGYTRTPSGGYDMYVVRTDDQGILDWKASYGTPNFDLGGMPAQNRSGGFAFTTTTNSGGPSQILVVATDATGNQLWSQAYSTPFPIGGSVLTALKDGGYLVMGWIQRSDYNSYLMRLDSAGNQVWARDYGGPGFETRTPRGAIEDLQGGYTFVTSTDQTFSPGLDRDIALVRVDTAGNLLRMVRLGGNDEELPRYFQQTPDSGYVVTGFSASFLGGAQQAYLGRLDSLGCTERFYALGSPQRDTLCLGDTLVLDAGPGFTAYTWSNGSNAPRLEVTAGDTFYVTALDSNGCIFHSTLHYIEDRTGLSFSAIDQGNLLVDFQGAPADATAWSWNFGNGQTSALPNPLHQYSAPGTYQVCLSAFIPACGLRTVCDTVLLLGTQSAEVSPQGEWRLRADPQTTEWVLQGGAPTVEPISVVIYSLDGRRVLHWRGLPQSGLRLPPRTLPAGLYTWRIQLDGAPPTQGKALMYQTD